MNYSLGRRHFSWTILSLAVLLSSSCAKTGTDKRDPYESFNRKVFAVNQRIDQFVMKPVATIYNTVLPYPIRTGVNNAFSNLGEISSFGGHLLQGSPKDAGHTLLRFLLNSTLGIGGLFDPASHNHLEKRPTDFGVTFAKWGDKNSPFIVLPLFGPSTIRDAVGFGYDFTLLTPYYLIHSRAIRYSYSGLWFVSQRAKYLETEKIMEEATFDKYTLQRDAYLQFRDNRIKNAKGEDTTDTYVEEGAKIKHSHKQSEKKVKPTKQSQKPKKTKGS
jgi:phospholipid-binding lipoprotein MlaA